MRINWFRSGFKYSVLEPARVERLKIDLVRLFHNEDNRRELSKTLKIMPFYFNSALVEEFNQPNYFKNYQEFIAQIPPVEQEGRSLTKYFTLPQLINISFDKVFKRYLEAYLHWLLNECTQFKSHFNDYLMEILNLERPDKWFEIKNFCSQRTFIYHHGPTNSGKSTAAVDDLKSLSSKERGIYMAPLRLLAWEYQQKLGNCTLITGQEKEYKNSNLISCTIQAAQLNDQYEVAVIDEIQMIEDQQRGWAWTKAILSTKAKRIHLCGDERALGIISKLVRITGDLLQERKYSRLSKLTLIHKIYKLEDIQPGDCIINFSMNSLIKHRNDMNKMLHQLDKMRAESMISQKQERNVEQNAPVTQEKGKTFIEEDKNIVEERKNYTAIVYGRLPSECRKDQAKSFNDGTLPYLVATNAIGMGLNLNIKKIVFMSIHRPNKNGNSDELEEHHIQQIAGRAGRGKDNGYVQCASPYILKVIKKALAKVNQSYGINLENLKESQQNEEISANEEIEEYRPQLIDQIEVYNELLKRPLKKKESQIKKACFFFPTDYIVAFKLYIHSVFGIQMGSIELLDFLKSYSNLGEQYFMQQSNDTDSILRLLEQYMNDTKDIMFFCTGLSLSQVSKSTKPELRRVIEHYQKEYVSNFVHYRKVDVPKTIVDLSHKQFSNFVYMDQINEMHSYFNLLETYVWLWTKYDFAFQQIDLAKEIKISLSNKISEVLLNNKFIESKNNKHNDMSDFSSFTKLSHPNMRPRNHGVRKTTHFNEGFLMGKKKQEPHKYNKEKSQSFFQSKDIKKDKQTAQKVEKKDDDSNNKFFFMRKVEIGRNHDKRVKSNPRKNKNIR